jgi:GNAT superfamily N-acetyltransferase
MNETIVFSEVKTLSDAQVVRLIRNECSKFMTRNSSYLSEEDQLSWFESLDFNTIKLFLVNITYHGTEFIPIGYGYTKVENNKVYLTGGLIASYRGKGYGRKLFQHLVETAKTFNLPISLEVLVSNQPAISLYTSIGFEAVSQNEKVIVMELKNDTTVQSQNV